MSFTVTCVFFISSWNASQSYAENAESEALIREGIALREAGKDFDALDRFRRAYELTKSPRALAQVGLAEQALGSWVDAEMHLERALRESSDPWISLRKGALDGALETIREHLGSLEVLSNVAGPVLKVNGKENGTLPMSGPARVGSGSTIIELSLEGYWPVTRTVMVGAGRLARELVEMAKRPPVILEANGAESRNGISPSSAPPTQGTSIERARTESGSLGAMPWIAWGGGALAIAAGAILYAGGASSASEVESSVHDRDEATSLRDRASSMGTAGAVLLIAGGALGATGGLLYSLLD